MSAGMCRSHPAAPVPTPGHLLQNHSGCGAAASPPWAVRAGAAPGPCRAEPGGEGAPGARHAPWVRWACPVLRSAGGRAAGPGRAAPLPMAVAAARARSGARSGARLSALLALPALALLALLALPPGRGAGAGGVAEAQPGSSPPLLLPPGLREELRQRRRDLRRLEAAAGGGEAAATTAGLGCGDLSGVTAVSVLGWGFTKVVARAALAGGGSVALKSVHGAGREVRRCVQRYGAPAGCRRLAAYKLLKELTLLRRLQHPGIVKVRRGGCGRRCRCSAGRGNGNCYRG